MSSIIPRSEWGARYRDGWGYRPLPATNAFLHHTVTASAGEAATFEQDAAMVRKVEDVGYSRFGGISYNFLITQAGRIFAGVSENRIGAHTAGYNTSGIGISLVGNYEQIPFTEQQVGALVWLLQDLRARLVLSPSAVLRGHRDVASTACPSAQVYALIPNIEAASRSGGIPTTGVDMLQLLDPAPAGFIRVFRMRDARGDYFYCTNAQTGNAGLRDGYTLEGAAFDVSLNPATNIMPLYQMRNAQNYHIYVLDREAAQLSTQGWVNEGVLCKVAGVGSGVGIYRLAKDMLHLYTASIDEADAAVGQGWHVEGVAFGCGVAAPVATTNTADYEAMRVRALAAEAKVAAAKVELADVAKALG